LKKRRFQHFVEITNKITQKNHNNEWPPWVSVCFYECGIFVLFAAYFKRFLKASMVKKNQWILW